MRFKALDFQFFNGSLNMLFKVNSQALFTHLDKLDQQTTCLYIDLNMLLSRKIALLFDLRNFV